MAALLPLPVDVENEINSFIQCELLTSIVNNYDSLFTQDTSMPLDSTWRELRSETC